MNIVQNQYYIKNLKTVIKSELKDKPKPWQVKDRHSDAFVYVLSGSCNYEFGDKSVTVKAGDIVYLANHSFYKMGLASASYTFIFCDFGFEGENKNCDVFTLSNTFEIKSLFSKLLKYYNEGNVIECMSTLYKIYGHIRQSCARSYIEKTAKQKIISAKEYIDSNYKDLSLSVASLSEKAGFSEVYFRKLFKSVYGITPSEYIISVRLKNAEMLMKYPFLSLSECAINSGFSSLQYFCRAFKKHTGMTPSKYKKVGFANKMFASLTKKK